MLRGSRVPLVLLAVLATAAVLAATAPADPEAVADPPAAVPATSPQPLGARQPRPPRLPRNFTGRGRWVVRSLGVTVPFTWRGRNGDSRMIAGGPDYPIWFTNLIYHDRLYTLTYKWPGLTQHPCDQIPGTFDLHGLNKVFSSSRFVGREILQGNPRRFVNHWRVGLVLPTLPPGNHWRFPLALGDIYVQQGDPGRFWQVLQFGIQNLYDPELDEWLVMDRFNPGRPGGVTLPGRCKPPAG